MVQGLTGTKVSTGGDVDTFTGNYTILEEDANADLMANGTAAQTVTLPAGLTAPFRVTIWKLSDEQHDLTFTSTEPTTGNGLLLTDKGSRAVCLWDGTTWHLSGDVWSGWQTPTLQNGWVEYDANVNWSPTRYCKDSAGVVHMRGLLRSGTMSAAMFTLPVGFRPKVDWATTSYLLCQTMSNNGTGRVEIRNDGTVVPTTGSNAWFSLANITFKVGS